MHSDFAHIGSPETNLIEECAELIQALTKLQRFGSGVPPYDNRAQVVAEIADVRRRITEWESDMTDKTHPASVDVDALWRALSLRNYPVDRDDFAEYARVILKAAVSVDADALAESAKKQLRAMAISQSIITEAVDALAAAARQAPAPQPFQPRVDPWLIACFGETIARDKQERNHRFLEEALELAQACDCTASEAHQLVGYVFGRPVGERSQEVGGVMVTLAALCLSHGLDMHAAGETELARIWTKVEAIRAKQAAKPKHSPLPAAQPLQAAGVEARESDQQLMRFYSADTLHELIDAQERHIERLQAKLPPLRDESPRNPRIG